MIPFLSSCDFIALRGFISCLLCFGLFKKNLNQVMSLYCSVAVSFYPVSGLKVVVYCCVLISCWLFFILFRAFLSDSSSIVAKICSIFSRCS
jgi:hypothetical protein